MCQKTSDTRTKSQSLYRIIVTARSLDTAVIITINHYISLRYRLWGSNNLIFVTIFHLKFLIIEIEPLTAHWELDRK